MVPDARKRGVLMAKVIDEIPAMVIIFFTRRYP